MSESNRWTELLQEWPGDWHVHDGLNVAFLDLSDEITLTAFIGFSGVKSLNLDHKFWADGATWREAIKAFHESIRVEVEKLESKRAELSERIEVLSVLRKPGSEG